MAPVFLYKFRLPKQPFLVGEKKESINNLNLRKEYHFIDFFIDFEDIIVALESPRKEKTIKQKGDDEMAVIGRPLTVPDAFASGEMHGTTAKSRVVNVLNLTRTLGESVLSLITGLLAAALILYSGYVLYDSFYTQNTAASSSWDLLQYKPEILEDGATPLGGGNLLAAVNKDYRAWLTLYDTGIDYAVMQGEDDLYYSAHNAYGESSLTGAIYLASGNNGGFTDTYNLIYGHHMDNGAMFGALDNFMEEEYFNTHREGVLVTTSGVYDLTVFAVVRTDAYEAQVYKVGSKTAEQVLNFIENAQGTILYRRDTANAASKIVAFSTCAAADTNGRLVVYAVMTSRDMSETSKGVLTLRLKGYNGVYDGQWHGPEYELNLADGVMIEFSTDNGETWSTEMPLIREVGTVRVLVRASHTGMESVSAVCELRVTPAEATVIARAAEKVEGEEDPEFTAVVEGLFGNDVIEYIVNRPGVGEDETVGIYSDAVVASGAAVQGSYNVKYAPANFTIKAYAIEEIEDAETPLASLARGFEPSGNSSGNGWALVNLICLIVTVYLLIPVMHLKDKYGRGKLLSRIKKEEKKAAVYKDRDNEQIAHSINRFNARFVFGILAEVLVAAVALVLFIITEDMRQPMMLIDRWTLAMVLLMLLCWIVDVVTVRVRDKELLEARA